MISLAEKAPFLTSEWSVKNQPLTPDDVSYGSNKIVWWNGICGHEWQASIKSRATGKQTGCPYCSGNRVLKGFNDLSTRFPEIASEWSDRNAPLQPEDFSAFANQKVWWKGRCGHEWKALISDRSAGHGCPYCRDHKLLIGFNDFQTLHPDLALEWSEQNDVLPNSIPEKKLMNAWWKCNSCGGEYRAWIISRLAGSKCPYCSNRKVERGINDLATTDPEIAAEWVYERNGENTPQSVIRFSRQEYWWRSSCGHEWKAKVSDRTVARIQCSKCESEFQSMLTALLIMLYATRNQEQIFYGSDEAIGSPLELYIPGLSAAIEQASTFSYQQKEQAVKHYICERQGIKYITYLRTDTIEAAAAEARNVFQKLNIFINTDIQSDIQIARQKFQKLKNIPAK
jgi:DNA-directed RNA polymerase subunit RPC12/RpoP